MSDHESVNGNGISPEGKGESRLVVFSVMLTAVRQELTATESLADRLRAVEKALVAVVEARNEQTHMFDEDVASPANLNRLTSGRLMVPSGASMREAVTAVLEHAARPLHIRDMYRRLQNSGWSYDKTFEVFRGSVYPLLRRDNGFEKVQPGIYKLK